MEGQVVREGNERSGHVWSGKGKARKGKSGMGRSSHVRSRLVWEGIDSHQQPIHRGWEIDSAGILEIGWDRYRLYWKDRF